MSFGNYINMEKIAIEIANEHIKQMFESEQYVDNNKFYDIDKLISNIKNGFIVITQAITFIESFLNTIINMCMLSKSELLLKMSIEEKIEVICMYYKVESNRIKSTHYWENFKTMTKIRNEMIHFKNSFICESCMIIDFKIANVSVKEYFNKSNMKKAFNLIIELGNDIAKELQLTINKNVGIIECDARDGLVSYVFDNSIIDVDPDRVFH